MLQYTETTNRTICFQRTLSNIDEQDKMAGEFVLNFLEYCNKFFI